MESKEYDDSPKQEYEEDEEIEIIKIDPPKPVEYDMKPVPPGPNVIKAVLSHKYTLKDSIKNVFASKFSPDGNFLAASYADGSIHVHTTFKGDRVYQPKI